MASGEWHENWKHIPMKNFNRVIAITAIWTLSFCYIPGMYVWSYIDLVKLTVSDNYISMYYCSLWLCFHLSYMVAIHLFPHVLWNSLMRLIIMRLISVSNYCPPNWHPSRGRSDRGVHPAVAWHQVQQVPQVARWLAQDEEAIGSSHAGLSRHTCKASIEMVVRRSFSLSSIYDIIFFFSFSLSKSASVTQSFVAILIQ